jgi:hypothetical protein
MWESYFCALLGAIGGGIASIVARRETMMKKDGDPLISGIVSFALMLGLGGALGLPILHLFDGLASYSFERSGYWIIGFLAGTAWVGAIGGVLIGLFLGVLYGIISRYLNKSLKLTLGFLLGGFGGWICLWFILNIHTYPD